MIQEHGATPGKYQWLRPSGSERDHSDPSGEEGPASRPLKPRGGQSTESKEGSNCARLQGKQRVGAGTGLGSPFTLKPGTTDGSVCGYRYFAAQAAEAFSLHRGKRLRWERETPEVQGTRQLPATRGGWGVGRVSRRLAPYSAVRPF